MDGIIYTIAGDKELPKLLMAIKSVRVLSNLPVFVCAYLSRRGYGILVEEQIPHIAVDCKLPPVQASRFLKTNVHTITPFDRTAYFDNDIITISDPSWLFDEIPESGVIFSLDHKKAKKYRNSTPGYSIRDEILKVFKVTIDDNWRIWAGGLFVFSGSSCVLLDRWHVNQLRVIAGIPHWNQHDQGALAAAVWECGLQDQAYLPREANWLYQTRNLGKNELGQYINTETDRIITNLHINKKWRRRENTLQEVSDKMGLA